MADYPTNSDMKVSRDVNTGEVVVKIKRNNINQEIRLNFSPSSDCKDGTLTIFVSGAGEVSSMTKSKFMDKVWTIFGFGRQPGEL
jgi:hypothetical protein